MIQLIGWIAALIAVLTALAQLHDAPVRPFDTSPRGWARHIAKLLALVGIAAAGAVICAMPSVHRATFYDAVLRLCLACVLAMGSPCPWWRYVFLGRGTQRKRWPSA